MHNRSRYLLKAFLIVLWLLALLPIGAIAQPSTYKTRWVAFRVWDTYSRPFTGCQLRVRLDPRSPNIPQDREISAEGITYRVGDTQYRIFDTTKQTADNQGRVLVPFVVYKDRNDCIGYEVALFYEGRQVSDRTARECVDPNGAVAGHFKADTRRPWTGTDWLLIGLLSLGLVAGITIGFYQPYYKKRIEKSYEVDRAEKYRNRAVFYWIVLSLVFAIPLCILTSIMLPMWSLLAFAVFIVILTLLS